MPPAPGAAAAVASPTAERKKATAYAWAGNKSDAYGYSNVPPMHCHAGMYVPVQYSLLVTARPARADTPNGSGHVAVVRHDDSLPGLAIDEAGGIGQRGADRGVHCFRAVTRLVAGGASSCRGPASWTPFRWQLPGFGAHCRFGDAIVNVWFREILIVFSMPKLSYIVCGSVMDNQNLGPS